LTEKSEKDRENVPAPSSEPIQEAFSQVAEHFLGLAQQWAPLVERIAAVAAENGLNPESIAERLASVQIIQEEPPVQQAPAQDKVSHFSSSLLPSFRSLTLKLGGTQRLV
jgi:hypothetical protein